MMQLTSGKGRSLALVAVGVGLVVCYMVVDVGLFLVIVVTLLGGFVGGLVGRSGVAAVVVVTAALVVVLMLDLAQGRPNPYDDAVGVRMLFAFLLALPAVPTAFVGAAVARRRH
jgi:hypothetical protein